MNPTRSSFYVTGGTLQPDALCYVEREADRDLYEGLLKGEFCYVLTSRQMGKSSLMVRTLNRLRLKKINVVALDLTAIGQNVTPEQWYDGLVFRLGQQLRLEDELEEFWRKNERVSPVQRFFSAIRDIAMANRPEPLVIFVDEIDAVRSLSFSTDEFFSAIRECFNRRTSDSDLNRLTFCLLGVASPSDLIRDTRTTPFNIGHRIELTDFSEAEATTLANGLGRESQMATVLLQRIIYWTNGHPYLTQRLCQAVATDPGVTNSAGVDRLCATLFLSHRARERDDNLLFVRERLMRSEADSASLLSLYDKVRAGKSMPDEETNPLVGILRLSGIVRVADGFLLIRNRIYARVFDRRWVLSTMPNQELRRQKEAFRKGILRGIAYATILVLAGFYVSRWGKQQVESLQAQLAIQNLGAAYNGLKSYEDHAVVKTEVQMSGAKVITSGLASMALEKPNKINLRFKQQLGIGETDVQIICDGAKLTVYRSREKEFLVRDAPSSILAIMGDVEKIPFVDLPEPLYGILASSQPVRVLAGQTRNARIVRRDELEDRKVYVLRWGPNTPEPPEAGEDSFQRYSGTNYRIPKCPVTFWTDQDDGLIRQVVVNWSGLVTNSWMPDLSGTGLRRVALKEIIATVTHTGIKINPEFRPATFTFNPPPDAHQVESFEPVRRIFGASAEGKPQIDRAKLPQLIPKRDPGARPELVDLTPYFNSPLTENWHSTLAGNDLAPMPHGIQTFAGTEFDVRGMVQASGIAADYLKNLFPDEVKNIAIRRKCRRIHFLHGTRWPVADGTFVGSYLIHFANGDRRIVPMIYGFDIRDWWPQEGEPKMPHGMIVAWEGMNNASRASNRAVRVYKSTWQNPLPEIEIERIDLISAMTESAPFLISITTE